MTRPVWGLKAFANGQVLRDPRRLQYPPNFLSGVYDPNPPLNLENPTGNAGARTEQVTVSDARTSVLQGVASLVEATTVGVSEDGVVIPGSAQRSETVTVSATQSALVTQVASRAETVTVGAQQSGGTAYSASRTEGVTTGAAQSATANPGGARVETVTLDDARSGRLVTSGARAEGVTTGAQQSAALVRTATRAETVTVADARTAVTAKTGARAESVAVSDAYVVARTSSASLTQTVTVDFVPGAQVPGISVDVTFGVQTALILFNSAPGTVTPGNIVFTSGDAPTAYPVEQLVPFQT